MKVEEVVKGLINKNEKIAEWFWTTNKMNIYRFVFSYIHNKEVTEDLTQDFIATLPKQLVKCNFKSFNDFYSWFYRSLYLKIQEYIQDNKISFVYSYPFSSEGNVKENLIIEDMINLLKDDFPIFILRFCLGFKAKEIAKIKDVDIHVILYRIKVIKKKVKEYERGSKA